MGFLDNLFDGSKSVNSDKKGDAVPENVPRSAPVLAEMTAPNQPDLPVPFGYKCSWLCVKSDDPKEVIEKLGLRNPEPANWDKGIEMAYNGCDFVSPSLDGYVLVVGWGTDVLTLAPELLEDSARKFPELQYFTTHRVVDYHAWVKYVGGELVRGYAWVGCDGELLMNKGEITPEEERLGFTNLLPSADADWDKYDKPDEDYVLEIAAAWGIDPSFGNKEYQKSMGYICK